MKKIFLPIVLVWRDKTIKINGASDVVILGLYIRKGRTLTLAGVDPKKRLEMKILGPMKVEGDLRLARTATEMSVEQMREKFGPFKKVDVADHNEQKNS